MNTILNALKQDENRRITKQLKRQLPSVSTFKVCFTNNDYLGLSKHPAVIATLQQHITAGLGQRGARLLMPEQTAYTSLEKKIAARYHLDNALLFSSGFQANATLLQALLNPALYPHPPRIFADRAIHASFHFGCQQKQYRFRHNDMAHLASLLEKHHDAQCPTFIVTESLFSMAGDIADIPTLIKLKKQYDACLIVDESHALGVLGQQGYGLCADYPGVDIVTSSLNKGAGVCGGFIACNDTVHQFLINRCFGFLYSNALPRPLIKAIDCVWDLIPTMGAQRQQLRHLSQSLQMQLNEASWHTGTHPIHHLIPIVLGATDTALAIHRALLAQGIWVACIRPPTVPPQQACLRVALTAQHQCDDIALLISALKVEKGSPA